MEAGNFLAEVSVGLSGVFAGLQHTCDAKPRDFGSGTFALLESES